jgi:glycosyltransferase involved in cell wall biosynthesis
MNSPGQKGSTIAASLLILRRNEWTSMLDRITPVILTYNESPNIGRILEKLRWARDIVVVDSISTDTTLEIIAKYLNVRFFSRAMTSLADQWNFAVQETGIATEWVLTLGADYVVTEALVAEMASLTPPADIVGYRINFTYCVHGIPLHGSLYPPDYKLLRRRGLSLFQDGHTDRARFSGRTANLEGHILHDDRKPLSRWLWSQDRYMAAEAQKLMQRPATQLDFVDRIRRRKWCAPLLVFLHCLFGKKLILDGKAGFFYALQRTTAEMILSINLIDLELQDAAKSATHPPPSDG